ncbi:MAG: hypothetical protein KAR80_01850, partial [Rhodospirillaceae bacterium]|nr:hypothetical protein [Rhodospirillaceae bacterium]
ELAGRLSMADLTRMWQMLLKGLGETRSAPSQLQGAEMVLVRLIYGLSLPSPADSLKAMEQGQNQPQTQSQPQPQASSPSSAPTGGSTSAVGTTTGGGPIVSHGPVMSAAAVQQNPDIDNDPRSMSELQLPDPTTFDEVVRLSEEKGEMILHANLVSNVHLVKFEVGRIEYSPAEHAPADLSGRLSRFLNDHTPRRWVVTVSRVSGAATIKQQTDALRAKERADAASHPLISAVLKTFPGAEVTKVTDHSGDVEPLKNAEEQD